MKLLFTDLETTGFDRRWDYIIEVASILYNTETDQEEARFHEYIKPGKKIPKKIIEITGITNQQVANARDEFEVLEDFFNFVEEIQPDYIVGHNYDTFDGKFLAAKADTYFFNPLKFKTQDTLKIARKKKVPVKFTTKTGRPSYRQESIAAAYKIEYDAHSAINDVSALIEIYKKMHSKDLEIKKARNKLGF